LRTSGASGLAFSYLAAESLRLLCMCSIMKWRSKH
jgi:hypothetical protein